MVRNVAPVVSGLFLGFLLHGSASAVVATRGEGCTAQFWRSHQLRWPAPRDADPLRPSDRFSRVFGVDHDDVTLGAALLPGEERGLRGARGALARAATAALLNAAAEDVEYPLHPHRTTAFGEGFVASVRRAWSSGDLERMRTLADELEVYNARGCPLE